MIRALLIGWPTGSLVLVLAINAVRRPKTVGESTQDDLEQLHALTH